MAVNHPLLLLIFLLAFKTGISAEISVFVQLGDSVHLDIQTHELPFLYWGKDNSTKIVTYISQIKEAIYDTSYKKRVNFNTETFSLTLKNMQKTDSGLYRARTIGDNAYVAAYRVSVMDAVEAPVLTVNSNWSSSDSCTVNFTCRAHDLMINSSYQNNSCSPEEVTSHINTLILNCSEESIICNHSNPVSSKKDRIEIKQICVNNKGHKSGVNGTKPPLQIWPFIPIGLCVFLAIAIFPVFVYRKFNKGAREADNTVYAQVEAQEMQKINSDGNTYDVPDRVQRHTHDETRDNLPNTTYCTVGQHQKPADFPEMDRTIYAAVCKQPKPPAISSDDA